MSKPVRIPADHPQAGVKMPTADTAPAGTIIHCRECDEPVAKLTRALKRGAVLSSDAVALVTDKDAKYGDVVYCPNDPAHRGSYATVNGERWYAW